MQFLLSKKQHLKAVSLKSNPKENEHYFLFKCSCDYFDISMMKWILDLFLRTFFFFKLKNISPADSLIKPIVHWLWLFRSTIYTISPKAILLNLVFHTKAILKGRSGEGGKVLLLKEITQFY